MSLSVVRRSIVALAAGSLLVTGLVASPQAAMASTSTLALPGAGEWQGYDVVIAPNGTFALASSNTLGKVFKINTATMAVTGEFNFTGAQHLRISSDSSFAIVSNYNGEVGKFDTATMTASAGFAFTMQFVDIGGIDLANDGSFGVISDQKGEVISFSTASGAVIRHVNGMGYRNWGIAISPTRDFVYVAVEGNGEGVKKVWLDGRPSPISTVASGYTAGRVEFSRTGNFAYASTTLGIVRIDTTTDTPSAPFGPAGRDISISPDGTYAYMMAGRFAHRIDTATTSRSTLDLGPGGYELMNVDISPDGTYAYMADHRWSTIYRIPMAPSAPSSSSASPGNQSATISVSAGSDGLSAITNYEYTLDNSTWIAMSPAVTSGPLTLTGLTNGTTYSVRVRAINAVGTGVASSVMSVTPRTVPGTPTTVTGNADNGFANIDWVAPDDTGGAPITGYRIESSTDGTNWVTVVSNTNWSGTGASVWSLTNGTPYQFRVSAINAAGAGSPSAASASMTPRTVPGAPTGVTATAGNAQATVTWGVPGNGGDPITSYTATASPGGATCTSTGTSCTISGLANGTAYTFTVRAANGAGSGPASTPSAPVTPTAPPAQAPDPAPMPLPEPTPTPSPSPSPTPTPTPSPEPTPAPEPGPEPQPEPGPAPEDDLKSMDGVSIPKQTSWEGLPPAPLSVTATRQAREGARVRVALPSGSAGTSVQATVVTVRDRGGKVAARVVVETPPGQELAVVRVPFVGSGFTVSAYNVNAHGVSTGAYITSPLVRASTVRTAGKKLIGVRAAKPVAFEKGSTRLDRGDKTRLRATAKRIQGTFAPIYITGLAGAEGPRAQELSVQRARVVAQYLSAQGVRVWIRFDGIGDKHAKGKPSDRRVEIRTISGG